MLSIAVTGLPDEPLAAAAHFHARILPGLEAASEDLLLVFDPAGHEHLGWRRAAVAALARAAAPRRVNAVAGCGRAAIASAADYLAAAPGVTGHYLVLDDSAEPSVLDAAG